MTTGERLEAAREAQGHSIVEACFRMQISVPYYYLLRKGAEPKTPLYRKAVEAYIAKAGG